MELTKGLVDIGYKHTYGEAGMKVMTLYNKIKIEMLLKDEALDEMLTKTGIAYSTFSQLKRRRPSLQTYSALAEYFGFDLNELRKLPITREEALDSELNKKRNPSAYDVIEEAYFSQWFLTGYKDEAQEEAKRRQKEIEESKELAKLQRQEIRESVRQTEEVNQLMGGLLDKFKGQEKEIALDPIYLTDEEPEVVEETVEEAVEENHNDHEHGQEDYSHVY